MVCHECLSREGCTGAGDVLSLVLIRWKSHWFAPSCPVPDSRCCCPFSGWLTQPRTEPSKPPAFTRPDSAGWAAISRRVPTEEHMTRQRTCSSKKAQGLLGLMALAVGSTVYFYSLNPSGCSLPFKSPESNFSR